MASINHCLTEAATELQSLSREELHQYAVDVLNLARKYQEKFDPFIAMKKAQEEVNQERLQSSFEISQIKINDALIADSNAKMIREKKANAREFLGTLYYHQGSNAEAAQFSMYDQFSRLVFDNLTHDEMAWFQDAKNDQEIGAALDGKQTSSYASKIAGLIKKYIETRNFETANAGVLPLAFMRSNRWLKAIHDPDKLLTGNQSILSRIKTLKKFPIENYKNAWREFIKTKLNIENTFEKTDALDLNGKISDEKVNEILDKIYNGITTHKDSMVTNSELINDAEAMAKKGRSFFDWKDGKSFVEYNQKYGHGNLYSSLLADMQASANKIGIAQVLGSSPLSAWNELKNVQEIVHKKDTVWTHNADNMFRFISGDSKRAKSPTIATINGNLLSLSSMARTGALPFQSLNDYSVASSYISRFFGNYPKALLNQIGYVLHIRPKEEANMIAKLFKTNLQHHIGFIGRFNDATNMSAITNKVGTNFYRYTGMLAHEQGNRMGAIAMMMKGLYENSSRNFKSLSPQLQKQLTKFDISPEEWNITRKYCQQGYFSTDNVNAIPENELKELWQTNKATPQFSQYRNMLYRKVYALFNVASNDSILTPNAYMHSLIHQGTNPGTILGAAWRLFTQFKNYPATYIDRTLVHGWRDADGPMAKLGWALQNFGYVLPLSYASNAMTYWLKNQTMPDPSQMSASDRLDFELATIFPALGSFLQLTNSQNLNQGLISNLFAGPGLKGISSSLSTTLAFAEGNTELGKKNFEKMLSYINPFATVPIIPQMVGAFLGDQPHLQPGQHQIIS